MLSRTTEYALCAVIYLAGDRARRHTARSIAEATGVPEGYLSKVLNTLAQDGIVNSQRGPTGGFSLVIAPEELTMLRVVRAVEPSPRIQRSPPDARVRPDAAGPLQTVLAELNDALETRLSETTIAQLRHSTRDQS